MTEKYYEWLQEPTVNEMEQAWESINEEIQECRQNDNTEQLELMLEAREQYEEVLNP
jgi:hypothetical protein